MDLKSGPLLLLMSIPSGNLMSLLELWYILYVCIVPPAGGRWSSPVLTGSRPAPRSDFTLTLIKTHQAVLFAGYNQTQRFNDIHVIDIEEMVNGIHNTVAQNMLTLCVGLVALSRAKSH